MSDLIDQYLETVARNLRGPAMESHHTLLETEDHLRSAAAEFERQGLTEDEAQQRAIAQFGAATDVANGHNVEVGIFTFGATRRALIFAALQLVGIGFAVIGASAVVAYVASLITSKEAVFGLPPNALPSAEQCSYWLSIHPTALNCQQAGTWEASIDSTWMLGLVGLIGFAILVALRFIKRSRYIEFSAIPPMLVPAISCAIFFLAAVGLLVFGQANGIVEGVWGRGRFYSESATSFVAFAIATTLLLRTIRKPQSTSD